jgi:hypothetical protein
MGCREVMALVKDVHPIIIICGPNVTEDDTPAVLAI